jgi:hypothetical protein
MTIAVIPTGWCRRALAKDAGIPAEGDGNAPHGIAINSEAGSFTDPDGFEWS